MDWHIYQSFIWSASYSAQCPAFIHSSPICLWYSVSRPFLTSIEIFRFEKSVFSDDLTYFTIFVHNFSPTPLLTYNFCNFYRPTDVIARFISSGEDQMKEYDALITILLIVPDYALSHALNALMITYVKHHKQIHSNPSPNNGESKKSSSYFFCRVKTNMPSQKYVDLWPSRHE